MNQFPKWKYHRTELAKIVETLAEEKSLGTDWADSPAEFQKSPVVQEAPKTEEHHEQEKPKRKPKGK